MSEDLREQTVIGLEAVLVARRLPLLSGIVLGAWLLTWGALLVLRPARLAGLPGLPFTFAIEMGLCAAMLVASRHRRLGARQRLDAICALYIILLGFVAARAIQDMDPLESFALVQLFFALLALTFLPLGPRRQAVIAAAALAGTMIATFAGLPHLMPYGFIVMSLVVGLVLTVVGQALARNARADLLATKSTLVRASAELVAQSGQRDAFFLTISHELRTPCHIMLGYLDLVLDGSTGDLAAGQREILERMRESGRRLSLQIGEALDSRATGAGVHPGTAQTTPNPGASGTHSTAPAR